MSSAGSLPRARAGILGAGIMTTIYVGLALTLVGNLPVPSFVTAIRFGAVAGSIAANQIRRQTVHPTLP